MESVRLQFAFLTVKNERVCAFRQCSDRLCQVTLREVFFRLLYFYPQSIWDYQYMYDLVSTNTI